VDLYGLVHDVRQCLTCPDFIDRAFDGEAFDRLQDSLCVLPGDRERLIDLLDGVLALAPEEQAEFALGVRLGVYRTPRDLRDGRLRQALRECAPGAGEAAELGKLDAAKRLRSRFL